MKFHMWWLDISSFALVLISFISHLFSIWYDFLKLTHACWLSLCYLNLVWLHDFNWLPSSHPNAMKFYMYTMLDVRIECDLFYDFWKCLGWLLMQVILLTFVCFPLLYFDFKCSWNDHNTWFECGPDCDSFLNVWPWLWLTFPCCLDFFLSSLTLG